MKLVKRLIAASLTLAMSLSLAVPAFAVEAEEIEETFTANETEEGVLNVRGVGHGEFRIESTDLMQTGRSSEDTIRLVPVSNRSGMYEDESGTIYLKCTDTSLLQVDEVPIDISNMDEVDQVIEEYGLSDIMANDLRNFCSDVEELRQAGSNNYPQVVLYTARDPENNTYSITPKEPRYYTYNGYNLKDDVFYTVYVTPFVDYAFNGSTTIDDLKNITDIALYVIGATNKRLATVSLIGSGVSLAFGMLQGWVEKYGESKLAATDGDWAQFAIDYTSNTKYTSVENSAGNFPTCAKTGDVLINRHGTNVFVNDCHAEKWYDVDYYTYTPNYPNPAPKAISSATGNIWIEELEYRTDGGYIFCPNGTE